MIITTCKSWCILAAAAAKLLQSCPTLCDPIDGSPPGSPVPRILQARTLEWVAISFSNAWKWKVNSYRVVIISSSWLIETKWIWKIPLEGGHGNPLQYCCLDRGAWRATVHAVAESNMTEQLTLSHCIYVLSIYMWAWSLVLWFVSIIVAVAFVFCFSIPCFTNLIWASIL